MLLQDQHPRTALRKSTVSYIPITNFSMMILRNGIDPMSITTKFPQIFDTSKMPEIVYHYTSVQGLFGIVAKKAIWATDFRFLNDADEIDHVFKHISAKPNINDYLQQASRKILGEPNYLIASFSEEKDNLAMWGRYSKDEGLNIGFSRESIRQIKAIEDNLQRVTIGKCVYSNEEKESIVNETISLFSPEQSLQMLHALIFIAPFLKNESFKHECEWRVVIKHLPNASEGYGKPLYRVSNNSIIPFMNVSIQNAQTDEFAFNRFEEINLSPKLGRTPRSEMMIRTYLGSNGIEVGSIRKSISSLV
jgi:hypothetical protein